MVDVVEVEVEVAAVDFHLVVIVFRVDGIKVVVDITVGGMITVVVEDMTTEVVVVMIIEVVVDMIIVEVVEGTVGAVVVVVVMTIVAMITEVDKVAGEVVEVVDEEVEVDEEVDTEMFKDTCSICIWRLSLLRGTFTSAPSDLMLVHSGYIILPIIPCIMFVGSNYAMK